MFNWAFFSKNIKKKLQFCSFTIILGGDLGIVVHAWYAEHENHVMHDDKNLIKIYNSSILYYYRLKESYHENSYNKHYIPNEKWDWKENMFIVLTNRYFGIVNIQI